MEILKIFITMLLFTGSLIFISDKPLLAQTNSSNTEPLSIDKIKFWGYQIQDINEADAIQALEQSDYDMLVIEPTRTDWSDPDEKQFDTKKLIDRLKNSMASNGINRKLLIAYIDIGEAEDWRWYWTWSERSPEDVNCDPADFPPPEWPDYIVKCDPDGFSGNYPVRFWDPEWKDIVIFGENTGSDPDRDFKSILDEVINDGFDGIYLDWVEASEDVDIIDLARSEGRDAVEEMITFIQEMRDFATERDPDFIIIQQNAASIIDGHPELVQVIDAIAQEAIWFDGDADFGWSDPRGCDKETDADTTDGYLEFLKMYKEANLPVFNCEYACKSAEAAYSRALGEGLIPYVSRRSLSELTETPPPLLQNQIPLAKNIIDWGYQLQGYKSGLRSLRDSAFDVIVMDYSASGGDDEEFKKEDINSVKFEGACDRKVALAYMSIGEAEEFRFYFDDLPEDLLFEDPNPQFLDNIKVRFWDERWQNIIFGNQEDGPEKSYLDRIIDAEFDGIYLDIIDAFEFWGPEDIGGNGERETAAKDMVDFVVKLSKYARNTRGKSDFIIVPQNGPGIIDPSSYHFSNDPENEADLQKERYFSAIDAIGAEDTFFFGNKENDNVLNVQDDTIALLNIFRDTGKVVLAVDYVQDQDKVESFYELARKEGYIPYATIRDLDTLTINESQEPVCNDNTNDDTTTPPTPTTTPIITVSPSPVATSTPENDKSFTFNCINDFGQGLHEIEKLTLKLGQNETCILRLTNLIPGTFIMVSTEIRKGIQTSIKIEQENETTDDNGEMEFKISSINRGTDWVSWAIPDKNGNLSFNKKAYDEGTAWGMFIEVK